MANIQCNTKINTSAYQSVSSSTCLTKHIYFNLFTNPLILSMCKMSEHANQSICLYRQPSVCIHTNIQALQADWGYLGMTWAVPCSNTVPTVCRSIWWARRPTTRLRNGTRTMNRSGFRVWLRSGGYNKKM